MNYLARSGFGKWSIVDEDILLPHNLARHMFYDTDLAQSKAIILAESIKKIFNDPNIAKGYHKNFFDFITETETCSIINNSDLIIDMSTSISVERALVYDLKTKARKITIFLSPSGNDLVILAEDKNRKFTLDQLEMQYYRALIRIEKLANHLISEGRIPYSQTCRNLSSRISQSKVALFAGIASKYIHNIIDKDEARINVWQLKDIDLSISSVPIKPVENILLELDGWKIYLNQELMRDISALRETKLPNETGGVLIGAYDMQRKIIYVVDTIPAPKDSKKQTTSFIRGF